MSERTEGKIVLLMSLCGCLCYANSLEAEEPLALSTEPMTFPIEVVPTVLPDVTLLVVPAEELVQATPEPEIPLESLSRLPSGREISDRLLRPRIALGNRIQPLIFQPNTTFRISSRGGFSTYLNETSASVEEVPLDPEELLEAQVAWGFQIAETTIEFFNSTAMPLLGGFVSGLTEMGQSLHHMDKRLKKRHLHLRYSDGMPNASYRVKF